MYLNGYSPQRCGGRRDRAQKKMELGHYSLLSLFRQALQFVEGMRMLNGQDYQNKCHADDGDYSTKVVEQITAVVSAWVIDKEDVTDHQQQTHFSGAHFPL